MNLKDTYNKIAPDWAKDHNSDGWWNEGTDKFMSLLPEGAAILDVGCGPGIKTKYLSSKGFKLTGIDFSEKMIEEAKKHAPEAQFFVQNIKEPLSFEESFDGIFAQAVLLHIEKKEIPDVLRNIERPLKLGGYFYLAVKELKPGDPEEEIVKENDYGYEYERFFSYFTFAEVKNLVSQLNMKIEYENIASSGRSNWIQVISKKVN